MLQFCSISYSLSHATCQIKWEVYFSKNCVAHLYYCRYDLCMHMHMSIQHLHSKDGYNLLRCYHHYIYMYIYIYISSSPPRHTISSDIPTLSRHHSLRPLLQAGLQDYTSFRHRAAVCRFELVVLPLLVHVKGSTGVHNLWARPYISSSILHVWFV